MRIAALIFGLLGAAGSGFLGAKWTSDIRERKPELDAARKLIEISGDAGAKAKVEELDRLERAGYALMGGAALGALGCVLVLNRKGMIAGLLFLVGFAVPIAIAQDGKPAVFSFGLALAGLMSFFVKPAIPYKKPKAKRDIPEDTDMVG